MPETVPPWWPDGVTIKHVRDCNCAYCSDLLDSYAQWREDKAGPYHTLDAF